jgi:hypothetical protein
MKVTMRLAVVLVMALQSSGCATAMLLRNASVDEPVEKRTVKVHTSFTVVTAHVVPAIPAAASGAADRRLHVCLTDARGDDLLAIVAAPYPFTDRADPSPDIQTAEGGATVAITSALDGFALTRDHEPVKFATAFEKGCGPDRQKHAADTVPIPVLEADMDCTAPVETEVVKEGLVAYTCNHYTYLVYVSRSPVFGGHHSVAIDPDEAKVPDMEKVVPPDLVFLPVAVLFDVLTWPFQIIFFAAN